MLAIALVMPNLIWQYNNNFPVFHHLNELATTQLVNVNRWEFLKQQIFYNGGSLFVILAGLYALLYFEPFKQYRFLFWSLFFTLIVFVYLRAKGYYALGLYPVYISFGSVFIGKIWNSGLKKYLKAVAVAFPILFYFLFLHVFFLNESPLHVLQKQEVYKSLGMLRWEDGKDHQLPQDFADMLGWRELARKVDAAYNKLPNKENTLVLCDNYGQAGAINFYSTNKDLEAVSFNADYINWFDLTVEKKNLIRVKDFQGSKTELAETSPFFNTSLVAGSITNPLAREYQTTIFVFTNPKIDINQRLAEELARKRSFK
jgi:hypothetical protein